MSHRINGPAVRKAADFLREMLQKGVWRSGDRLPSTVKLAVRAGVSSVTMVRAVALFKAQGLITGVERAPLRVAGAGNAEVPAALNSDQVWMLKRSALEQDILGGMYAEKGKLPLFKELEARYGVCHRTMRKILRSMVADGVVRLRGRDHEIQGIRDRPPHRRIVFLTHREQAIPRSALNQGQYRLFDLFEYECIRREFTLELVDFDFSPAAARRAQFETAINAPALGYVLDLQWYTGEEFRRSHVDILARLSARKRPVALLDEDGRFELPAQFAANPLLQVFRIEGKRAGSRMARLLLGMGHRSVAYLSSRHETDWSRQRFDGIMEQYTRAGCGAGVHSVIGENMEVDRQYALSISGFDETMIRRILAARGNTFTLDGEYRSISLQKKNAPAPRFSAGDRRWIRQRLGTIRDVTKRDPGKAFFNHVCEDVMEEIGTHLGIKIRVPLFERALARHPEATAWICATDGTALMALSFLRDQGIEVPRDLSVAGFDNQPVDALERRLTTLDFNAQGFVHRMLNFLTRPPTPRGPHRHAPIEVEGIIMARDTTAPPRR